MHKFCLRTFALTLVSSLIVDTSFAAALSYQRPLAGPRSTTQMTIWGEQAVSVPAQEFKPPLIPNRAMLQAQSNLTRPNSNTTAANGVAQTPLFTPGPFLPLRHPQHFRWIASNGESFVSLADLRRALYDPKRAQALGVRSIQVPLNNGHDLTLQLAGPFPAGYQTADQWRALLSAAMAPMLKRLQTLSALPDAKLLLVLAPENDSIASGDLGVPGIVFDHSIFDAPQAAHPHEPEIAQALSKTLVRAALSHMLGYLSQTAEENPAQAFQRRNLDIVNMMASVSPQYFEMLQMFFAHSNLFPKPLAIPARPSNWTNEEVAMAAVRMRRLLTYPNLDTRLDPMVLRTLKMLSNGVWQEGRILTLSQTDLIKEIIGHYLVKAAWSSEAPQSDQVVAAIRNADWKWWNESEQKMALAWLKIDGDNRSLYPQKLDSAVKLLNLIDPRKAFCELLNFFEDSTDDQFVKLIPEIIETLKILCNPDLPWARERDRNLFIQFLNRLPPEKTSHLRPVMVQFFQTYKMPSADEPAAIAIIENLWVSVMIWIARDEHDIGIEMIRQAILHQNNLRIVHQTSVSTAVKYLIRLGDDPSAQSVLRQLYASPLRGTEYAAWWKQSDLKNELRVSIHWTPSELEQFTGQEERQQQRERRDVVGKIRAFWEEGHYPYGRYASDKLRALRSEAVAVFRTWSAALLAAGVPYIHAAPLKGQGFRIERRYVTRQEVDEDIRFLMATSQLTSVDHVRVHRLDLLMKALDHYETWANAVHSNNSDITSQLPPLADVSEESINAVLRNSDAGLEAKSRWSQMQNVANQMQKARHAQQWEKVLDGAAKIFDGISAICNVETLLTEGLEENAVSIWSWPSHEERELFRSQADVAIEYALRALIRRAFRSAPQQDLTTAANDQGQAAIERLTQHVLSRYPQLKSYEQEISKLVPSAAEKIVMSNKPKKLSSGKTPQKPRIVDFAA
jgi:hypothetical protein